MPRVPPTIDLRPDGSFSATPRYGQTPFGPQRLGRSPFALSLSTKLIIGAFLVATVAFSLALAAVAVWVLSLLLPVLVGAAIIGWGALKFRQWRARGRGLPRRF